MTAPPARAYGSVVRRADGRQVHRDRHIGANQITTGPIPGAELEVQAVDRQLRTHLRGVAVDRQTERQHHRLGLVLDGQCCVGFVLTVPHRPNARHREHGFGIGGDVEPIAVHRGGVAIAVAALKAGDIHHHAHGGCIQRFRIEGDVSGEGGELAAEFAAHLGADEPKGTGVAIHGPLGRRGRQGRQGQGQGQGRGGAG